MRCARGRTWPAATRFSTGWGSTARSWTLSTILPRFVSKRHFKHLVANASLFGIFFKFRYSMEVDKEKNIQYIQYFGWDLLVVLSARCGLAAWMN
jgi:hypothetical protein